MAGFVSSAGKSETRISVFLNVRRGASAIEFYMQAFGAVTVQRLDGDDGSVVAHLAVGAGDFWLGDESVEYQNLSPESLGGTSMRMVLIVDDPHAVFAQAIAAGAKAVHPVRDEDYGWRIGRLVDPFGHHWEIGKPLLE